MKVKVAAAIGALVVGIGCLSALPPPAQISSMTLANAPVPGGFTKDRAEAYSSSFVLDIFFQLIASKIITTKVVAVSRGHNEPLSVRIAKLDQ